MNKNTQKNNQIESSSSNIKKIRKVIQSSKSLEKIKSNKSKNKINYRQNKIHPFTNNIKYNKKIKPNFNEKSLSKKRKIFPSEDTKKIKINNSNIIKSINKNKINTIKTSYGIIKNFDLKNKCITDTINKNISTTRENTIKINLKKISKKNLLASKYQKNNIPYVENLKYISLRNVSSLHNALQNYSLIYKVFEEKFLRKNNFEFDTKTFIIKTKNHENASQLNNQKFWILYIEYLIYKNLILNGEQFLSVINEAFSYMDGEDEEQNEDRFNELKNYFLEKIKIYAPCYLKDGSLDNNNETYINKLNNRAIYLIKKFNRKISNCMNKKYKICNEKNNFNDENKNNNTDDNFNENKINKRQLINFDSY